MTEDHKLEGVLSLIRGRDKGVVGALEVYGRGADIRFKKDSFVIIGFLPVTKDKMRQMVGRSSRTFGNHKSKLIAVHKTLTSGEVDRHLDSTNNISMFDGLDIAKVMRGRRRSQTPNDASILNIFKKGWLFKLNKISKVLG